MVVFVFDCHQCGRLKHNNVRIWTSNICMIDQWWTFIVKHSAPLCVSCLFELQRCSCTDKDKKVEHFIFNLTVECGGDPLQSQTPLTENLTRTQGATVILATS